MRDEREKFVKLGLFHFGHFKVKEIKHPTDMPKHHSRVMSRYHIPTFEIVEIFNVLDKIYTVWQYSLV